MAKLVQLCKENPQIALLAVIALVLGIGTFIAVIVALVLSGSTTTDGEPSDVILLGHLLGGLAATLSSLLAR